MQRRLAHSPLASQSLLAWCLGPAGRGSFAVCLVIGTLMPTVFGLALDRAIRIKLAAGQLSTRAAPGASGIVTLIAGAIAMLRSVLDPWHRGPGNDAFASSLASLRARSKQV